MSWTVSTQRGDEGPAFSSLAPWTRDIMLRLRGAVTACPKTEVRASSCGRPPQALTRARAQYRRRIDALVRPAREVLGDEWPVRGSRARVSQSDPPLTDSPPGPAFLAARARCGARWAVRSLGRGYSSSAALAGEEGGGGRAGCLLRRDRAAPGRAGFIGRAPRPSHSDGGLGARAGPFLAQAPARAPPPPPPLRVGPWPAPRRVTLLQGDRGPQARRRDRRRRLSGQRGSTAALARLGPLPPPRRGAGARRA